MSNKTTSIYFAVFSVIYIIYTVSIVGHGLHITNVGITVFLIGLSGYYFLKYKKEQK